MKISAYFVFFAPLALYLAVYFPIWHLFSVDVQIKRLNLNRVNFTICSALLCLFSHLKNYYSRFAIIPYEYCFGCLVIYDDVPYTLGIGSPGLRSLLDFLTQTVVVGFFF